MLNSTPGLSPKALLSCCVPQSWHTLWHSVGRSGNPEMPHSAWGQSRAQPTEPAHRTCHGILQSKGNILQEAGMEIPVEISVPDSSPKAPVSHFAVVSTADPQGNRIFPVPVITATHPQHRDQGLQERIAGSGCTGGAHSP